MRIPSALLLLILSLQLSAMVHSETLKDPAAARELTDRIMSKVGNGDINSALTLMKPYVVIPDIELEAVRQETSIQLPIITQRFGKAIGFEFISEDKKGESLLRIVEIQKFERHVLRWTFYFYRNNEGWVLNSFKYDDAIQTIF